MKIFSTLTIKKIKGTIYIFLLMIMTIMAVAAESAYETISHEIRKEKEEELLRIGNEFRRALKGYYEWHGLNQYPLSLKDLVLDKRPPNPISRWRKLYYDPLTNTKDWKIVRINDHIVGIYSSSTLKPIKRFNPSEKGISFALAKSYQDWKFTYPEIIELPK